MPDQFEDVLDRLDVGGEDETEFGTIRGVLQSKLGTAASPLQETIAQNRKTNLQSLASAIGATIERRALREGNRMVERVSLRSARGTIVARGGRRVSQFLADTVAF